MQVVFMNTFDRIDGERTVVGAQVSICEHEGAWIVLWTEASEDADTWYEGASWEEMLASFRHGIAIKMGAGFMPIIDGMLEERKTQPGGIVTMLQCYGELNTNADLFEELREWRKKTASQLCKSAYLIATNRLLTMISAFKPHNANELAQIPGWGETKMKEYAEQVLEITSRHTRDTSFPLDWVTKSLDPKTYMQWSYKQKEQKYRNQMDRHQEKKQILQAIADGRTLTELQAELEMTRRNLIERIEQLETDGYNMDAIVLNELAEMPEEEKQSVLQAFDIVGDKYLKPVLQHVYGTEVPPDKPMDLLYDRLRFLRLSYRRDKMREAM
ncbi:HRDC domain-containing protein [Paenibacillus kobensis]|uniref:HRDC domain-containing protein n=1 Tax=Paenibacillus kobensis TaxID=59841 RepID=UPI000FD7A9F0|nr:HRDC domain-containing protein [Paenibacillus kobensis]